MSTKSDTGEKSPYMEMKDRILARFQEEELANATTRFSKRKPRHKLPKRLQTKALKKAHNRFRRLLREMEGPHDGSCD